MAFKLKLSLIKSKYKYVLLYLDKAGNERWTMRMGNTSKAYNTEREAAIAADKKLISKSKEPVNILTRIKKFDKL